MNNKFFTVLKYIDCFGTSFNFYIEKSRKFYTAFGGILTLLSLFIGLFIFTYIKIEDFIHNNPNSTTSIEKGNYKNVKFNEEKIWIPWRIRDFGGKTVEHKNIFYPIIFYYKGVRNFDLNKLEVTYEFLNYKLCNETSMINNTDSFRIDIELDKLYCIDMEDLNIGGSWDSDFLNLVTLDIYVCENGIEYNESNHNCTSYEKIREITGYNDSFEFEMYYPVVQYQPMNKTTPMIVRYYNYFYHFSRYSNKIDRLYLEQHILKDDIGFVLQNEKISSNWGCSSLSGDSYTTGDGRDLMNEGSSSRLYSFNIYLKPEVIIYSRRYKKLYLIIADGLPIVNVVFTFFGFIASILKVSSANQKLTELVFNNIKKSNTVKEPQIKTLKLKGNEDKNIHLKKNTFQINNISINNNINDFSSIHLTDQDSRKNRILYSNIERTIPMDNKKKVNFFSKGDSDNFFNSNNILNNYIKDKMSKKLNLSNINRNNSVNEIFNIKCKDFFLKEHDNNIIRNTDGLLLTKEKKLAKKPLFPYKYYLCSIFIKSAYTSSKPYFFTKKFMSVYNLICQLFDITSYLLMQKEFDLIKKKFYLDNIENIKNNNTRSSQLFKINNKTSEL